MKVKRILAGKEFWLLVFKCPTNCTGSHSYSFDFWDYSTLLFKKNYLPPPFGAGALRLDWLRFLSLPTKTIPINIEIISAFQIEREADLSCGSGSRNGVERNLEGGISGAFIPLKYLDKRRGWVYNHHWDELVDRWWDHSLRKKKSTKTHEIWSWQTSLDYYYS